MIRNKGSYIKPFVKLLLKHKAYYNYIINYYNSDFKDLKNGKNIGENCLQFETVNLFGSTFLWGQK